MMKKIIYAVGLLLAGCQTANHNISPNFQVDLALAFLHRADTVNIYQGLDYGGEEVKKRPAFISHNCIIREDKKLIVEPLDTTTVFADISFKALQLDTLLHWNKQLYIALRNSNLQPITLEVSLIGFRNRMVATVVLLPSRTDTITFPLLELPLTAGNKSTDRAVSLRWEFQKSFQPFTIEAIWINSDKSVVSPAVVDSFGQRKHSTWEGKVRSVVQLQNDYQAEKQNVKGQYVYQADDFGGFRTLKAKHQTGYFTTEQDGQGRWWLVTPQGHYFWSYGVTGVRPISVNRADVTSIVGRAHLYDYLPDKNTYSFAYKEDTLVSFYRLNIARKYPTLAHWAAHTVQRLKSWGVNTLGNWSDTLVMTQNIPFTVALETNPVKHEWKIYSSFSDVFDPAWQAHTDSVFGFWATRYANNPYLIGYFVDNEKKWHSWHFFDSPDSAHIRKEWVRFLQKKYTSLSLLNQAWQTSMKDWEQVRLIRQHEISANYQQDFRDFFLHYAKIYFQFVKQTLRRYDKNHLYLGCRFLRMHLDTALVALYAQYGDVLSMNNYDYYPRPNQMQPWYQASRLPILIGEFHITLGSSRQLPPTYPVFSADTVEPLTIQYVQKWAEQPYSIGCHWYQWVDQPLLGRAIDGENQTIGVVDITDRPYPALLNAFQKIGQHIQECHASTR